MAKSNSNGKRSGQTSHRAASYIRMSSHKQETSPEQQRREIIELAKRKGYEIVERYIDEGISGDEIEKRPDFLRMLKDAQAGKFDVILCWDQDRFGRFDSLKAGYVIEPLRMRGVRLVTVTQGEIDWNDFAGRMMYAIQQEGKNQFLHSLSQNVLRGRIQIAKEGYGAASPPYGYDRVFYDAAGNLVHRVRGGEKFSKPKTWKSKIDISENVEEVETLRYVFDCFANTELGVYQIACELQRKGIQTRNGLEWSHRSLRVILQNPVYIGTMIFGKRQQGRFNWVGNGTVGGNGPVVIEDAHPAIIDEKTFAKVQQKLAKQNYRLSRARDNDYVLSGIMVCGLTGKNFWGRRSAIGAKLAYYVVKRPKEIGSEICFSIRKDQIEEFILGKMMDLINQPELRDHIRKAVAKRMTGRKKKGPDLKKLQKQLADLDGKIERATERILLVDSEALQDANRLLATWRDERRGVANEIAQATKDTNSDPEAQVNAVMARLANLKVAIQLADPLELKAALKATIQDITIYWGPGGPRKWRLYRGVIRLREPLLFKDTCANRRIEIADTYGQILMLTRKDIINDDLNAFLDITRQMGRSGAESIDDLFFTLLLANANSFFSVGNGNYQAGADTAFGADALTTAKTLFRKQKAGPGSKAKDKKPINVRPELLVVPVELETEAELLMGSAQLMIDAMGSPTRIPVDNPHRNKYRVVSMPHLSDSYYTGNSARAWYLFANPVVLPAFELVFLNGRKTPVIERVEAPPDTLGMGFRGFLDVGCAQQEPRGAVLMKGEA